jgi:magnesium chelatase subunit H
MKVTVLYVGSSLLAPLKNAEREINRDYNLDLRIAAYNFGAPLDDIEWSHVERDVSESDVLFVIHVMDGENAARLLSALERHHKRHHAVIVINCMPELMRRTRMGRLDVAGLFGQTGTENGGGSRKHRAGRGLRLLSSAVPGLAIKRDGTSNGAAKKHRGHGQYLRLVDKLPGILRFVPSAGTLGDVKNYLYLFCYFLQPTPANIRSMILYALKHYVAEARLKELKLKVSPPETMPSVAIYHPDAPGLFESFDTYRKWYTTQSPRSKVEGSKSAQLLLDPESTVGLLLMRPQIISNTRKHYDALIRAIEAEGLSVIPAISTLMDNREACQRFFVQDQSPKDQRPKTEKRQRKLIKLSRGKSDRFLNRF